MLVPFIDDSVPLMSPKTVDGVIILHVWHLGARQGKEVPFETGVSVGLTFAVTSISSTDLGLRYAIICILIV